MAGVMPTRKATATWKGPLKGGTGHFKGEGGLEAAYAFSSRFEDGPGSNPEELLAAAHASCYSMALNAGLERAGFAAEEVSTTVACTLEKVGEAMTITKMKLTTRAKVAGISAEDFAAMAESTKTACIISRALNVAEMELDAALVSAE
jgi:lipoyl-dependent peroxiredoxin